MTLCAGCDRDYLTDAECPNNRGYCLDCCACPEHFCDNCGEAKDGNCARCHECENCGELTDNDADEYGNAYCSRCEDGCGTCGYMDCQCDAMYEAYKERRFDD